MTDAEIWRQDGYRKALAETGGAPMLTAVSFGRTAMELCCPEGDYGYDGFWGGGCVRPGRYGTEDSQADDGKERDLV